MAKLITNEQDFSKVFYFNDPDYVSLLGKDNCVITQENMKFENKSGPAAPNANLYIFDSADDGFYAVATTLESYPYKFAPALGTGYVGIGESNTTNISLTLNGEYLGDKKLHFNNSDVETINGSTGNDVIYINSNGVNSKATLDFSQDGTDAIKFNGATTVQNISGGGVAYFRD